MVIKHLPAKLPLSLRRGRRLWFQQLWDRPHQ